MYPPSICEKLISEHLEEVMSDYSCKFCGNHTNSVIIDSNNNECKCCSDCRLITLTGG